MFRLLKYLFFSGLAFLFLACIAAGAGLYYLVVLNPGPEIEESYINAILGRESPVVYRDGEEKIGVLFQGIHRQYLPYDQIPQQFIHAIVAAEDDKFFEHYGVDFRGIMRAMIANVKAGRVVQGGSSLTQQTAKNLYKRESRSYQAKIKELLYALRLEYHYPKEKILEFYCNQFYVNGNGHGLGIAARYYFDKVPGALSLLESAFIAGSVKRPNAYNPFIKKDQEDSWRAWKKAGERAGYVLGKMLKAGMISKAQYEYAVQSDIVFNQGKMAYTLNTIMDLVKDGLEAPEISEALEEHGIYNVSTSGVKIVTSIDRALQEKSLYALRRHLSRLDVRLRGYERKAVQQEYAALEYDGDTEIRLLAFVFATVSNIETGKEKGPLIHLDFGPKNPPGVIERQGLSRMLTALVKYHGKRWSEAADRDVPMLLKELAVGDRVYVSIRETALNGELLCDLERFPEVQGGALVMEKGALRAMAGGVENRYFNRAIDAKRLMGSTFKPFLFTAALQLGWNSVDMLDNRRNVFNFMNRPYFPRPDHNSPHESVSMNWAGTYSENVAAVWLLYHLLDHLTPPRLRELAVHLGMAPLEDERGTESYEQFTRRIRDRLGVQVTGDALARAAYDQAVQVLRTDFLFDDRMVEYQQLQRLPYGLHYDVFREEIKAELAEKGLKNSERTELQSRLNILRTSFLALEPVFTSFNGQRRYITQLLEKRQRIFGSLMQPSAVRPLSGLFVQGPTGEVIYTEKSALPEGWNPMSADQLVRRLEWLDASEHDKFWEAVQLEGVVSSLAYQQVREQMGREHQYLRGQRPYSMEVLGSIQDYRVMLGLQYLIQLGKECGINSRLEPVLSFPLGSNVITLAESVRLYETMVTGIRYDMPQPSDEEFSEITWEGEAVIERIETPGGNVVYARQSDARRVVDQRTTAMVTNILENVVTRGTGSYAHAQVRLHSDNPDREKELAQLNLPVPVIGKTGTANLFRNAAFLGYVPVGIDNNETTLNMQRGYTVGVYVGYDSNEPMRKGTTSISGSAGALPIWSDIAHAILMEEGVGDILDPVDLTFNGLGLKYPESGQVFVPFDSEEGGGVLKGRDVVKSVVSSQEPVMLSYGRMTMNGDFEPERFFQPFWMNTPEKMTH